MIENFVTWTVGREICSFGPVVIRWYSMMFIIGFTLAYWMVSKMYKREGEKEENMGTLLIYLVIGTIVGARLGHCLFYEPHYYLTHPAKILCVWEGGLASHGGTIGVILAMLIYSRRVVHRPYLWIFDRIAGPTALVSCLIRMGNLFNSEIYGHPTDLPWGFNFPLDPHWPGVPCHPTQLYEGGAYLLLFALLMWLYWKRNAAERPGLILGLFFIGCFGSRMLIELVKNPQEDFEAGMLLNMGQLLSLPFVIAGVWLTVRALRRPRVTIAYPNRYADAKS